MLYIPVAGLVIVTAMVLLVLGAKHGKYWPQEVYSYVQKPKNYECWKFRLSQEVHTLLVELLLVS